MATRFTETNKWKDKWFRSLDPLEKVLFIYLIDNCDNAGFIEIDLVCGKEIIPAVSDTCPSTHPWNGVECAGGDPCSGNFSASQNITSGFSLSIASSWTCCHSMATTP